MTVDSTTENFMLKLGWNTVVGDWKTCRESLEASKHRKKKIELSMYLIAV